MISSSTFQFLRNLENNNNREWFADNKPVYEEARSEFENFIDMFIARVAAFDSSVAGLRAKDRIFRIYRDVRFSKDKSPYKCFFGAHINGAIQRSDIHSQAGYYIHLQPGGKTMLAGGAYRPHTAWLANIREQIAEEHQEFIDIINSESFIKYFTFEGEKLVRPPKGFDSDHPAIDWLKYKSFLATHFVKDDEVVKGGFIDYFTTAAQALKPFDDYLNRAVDMRQ